MSFLAQAWLNALMEGVSRSRVQITSLGADMTNTPTVSSKVQSSIPLSGLSGSKKGTEKMALGFHSKLLTLATQNTLMWRRYK